MAQNRIQCRKGTIESTYGGSNPGLSNKVSWPWNIYLRFQTTIAHSVSFSQIHSGEDVCHVFDFEPNLIFFKTPPTTTVLSKKG